jgi:putative membrane protein
VTEEAVAEEPQSEGERTHVLGLFVGFITGLPQLFFPIIAVIFGTGSRNNPQWIPLVILGVMLISLLFRWIAWLRFRFHLDEDDIRIEQGILNRTVRSIPYDRIQDVSIEQKPLARLFDLGEVKFETGGGEGEDAKLSFVSMDRAEALRETVRARKADGGAVVAAALDAEERPPVFAMDNGRLVTLGLYSFSLVIFAVLGGLAQQFDFLLPYDWWDFKHWIGLAEERGVDVNGIGTGAGIAGALFALLALVFIGFATGIVRTFLQQYGFRLDRNERGYRRRRGLLTKTDVVMPVNRVQAAVVVTGPIRKRRGWYALKFVSLAQDSKEESDFMAAPLARLEEIWPIAAETGLLPPDAEAAFRTSRFAWWATGLIGLSIGMVVAMAAIMIFADAPFAKAGWMLVVPLLFLPLVWLEWRHYGDLVDARQLYVREGWWRQRLAIAPQVNVQSAEISQGPIARMLGLSELHFGIAGGTLAFSALPLEHARALRDAVMAKVAPVDFSELNQRDG